MATNLKVFGVVLATLLFYTALANMIPQVESDVPQELSFSAQVTPEELVAAGEQLYNGAGGCTACHGLGTRAPNLLTDEGGTGQIGTRCARRVAGKTCKQYLHDSMVEPGEYVVEGYQAIMPDMRRTLSAVQIWAIIAYLESLGGDVTVTAEDLIEAEAASGGAQPVPTTTAGQTPPGAGTAAPTDPRALLQAHLCITCHKLGDEGGPIGPPFDGMGSRLSTDAIRRGILEPNADTAQGFAAMAGTMPQTFGQQLSAAQLEALVQFLSGLK
jgi:mono/diheme cytochrome c family protein